MLLIRWAVLAFSMWIATLVVPGISVDGGLATYLWVALLFGLINTFFGSIIKVLTFPVSLVTFGLFLFVVNAAMLSLTARWSEKLEVSGFWSALFASLIISVITTILKPLKKQVRKLKPVLLVSLGGVLGSLLRWALSIVIPASGAGTLAANLLAIFLAIFAMVLMERRGMTELRYFLLPGFCGGLSTFSAVTFEAVAPGEAGFAYLVINIVASLTVAYFALKFARKLIKVRS